MNKQAKPIPHKKLIKVNPGQTAVIIDTKNLAKLQDALSDADTMGGYYYTEEILGNATIVKN